MAKWVDLAEWRGPTPNEGPSMVEWRGLVIHIAEGYYEGTISWQKNPANSVSSHFVLAGPHDVQYGKRDGQLAQVVDTATSAWTQRAGNGHWLSVECSGFTPNKLSAAQVESIAQLLARCHKEYKVPLQIATNPEGRGLGHHSMGTNGHDNPTDTWTGATWGHEDCPGPNIVNQKPQIVSRAIEIVSGVKVRTDMEVLVQDPSGQVWHCWGGFRRKVKPEWLGTANPPTGPITNSQVHQQLLLGMLATNPNKENNGNNNGWVRNGTVFNAFNTDMDVWGIDVDTLKGGGGGGLVQHTHGNVSVTVSGSGSGATGPAVETKQ